MAKAKRLVVGGKVMYYTPAGGIYCEAVVEEIIDDDCANVRLLDPNGDPIKDDEYALRRSVSSVAPATGEHIRVL